MVIRRAVAVQDWKNAWGSAPAGEGGRAHALAYARASACVRRAASLTTKKLAIITTHPIQYQAPIFRGLAEQPDIDLEVFFCHNVTAQEQAGAGYGVEFDWDIPLLDGYQYRFLTNIAKHPGISSFSGLDTPEVKKIIAGGRYDAVLLCGWNYKSAWQAIFTCWRTKTPVMVRGDSHLHTHRGLTTRALKWLLYRRFIPRFDACLAVGQWSREYYLHYGARAERIFFVPHVVDNDFFEKESERLEDIRPELRKGWEIPEDVVVFLFAGRFVAKKRPMDFVRAIEMAANRGAAVMGLMAGDGALREQCEAYVDEKIVPVRFTGFLNQSQIPRAYVAADALVLPSDGRETWGLVVNEAMACGRACIISDQVGCSSDLIVRGKTGDLFPAADIEGLARLTEQYAKDPMALAKMGESARARLCRYDVNAAVDGIRNAIGAVSV